MAAVLIAGVPRSGTTWTGRALGATVGAAYLNEPDGFRDPYAFRAMLRYGETPVLAPGAPAPDLERLWAGALGGGRRSRTLRARPAWRLYERSPVERRRAARAGAGTDLPLRIAAALAVPPQPDLVPRHVVVKSVQCALSLDWIADRFAPRVLVVERHPMNVLASWIELGFLRNPREAERVAREADRRWGLAPPAAGAPLLEQQAFQLGVLASALRESLAAHPQWVRTTHEHLCLDPAARLRGVATALGLEWGADAEQFVAESDAEEAGAGEATPFRTRRRARDQPDRWRTRLDAAQVDTIRSVLDRFPHALLPPDGSPRCRAGRRPGVCHHRGPERPRGGSVTAVVGQVVKHAARTVDRVRTPPRGVVVLIYHRVGRRSSLAVDLPAARFDEQMAALAASGRVRTLDEALDLLAAPLPPPVDPVVVTFDDGTADFADVAMPILERHGVPATLYVATDFVDRGRPFPDDGTPLSWAALRDTAASGLVTVGSHTHTHALLDRLPAAEVAAELDRASDLIADNVGAPPAHFAYPKAVAGSPAAEAEVRARHRSAAVAGTRPNRFGATDPYRLARSPIQVADGMTFFHAKAAGGMRLEDDLRTAANRWRYRKLAG